MPRYRNHLLVRETNERGLSFHFEWDAETKPRAAFALGATAASTITSSPTTSRATSPPHENSLGHKTHYEHDGALVKLTFDAFDNVRTTENDDDNRVTAEIDELGNRTTTEYGVRGNLVLDRPHRAVR
jgi:hypothetical protein